MTRTEALQAIKQGKKVTHGIFEDWQYLHLSFCGQFIVDEVGDKVGDINDPIFNMNQSDCTENNWRESV